MFKNFSHSTHVLLRVLLPVLTMSLALIGSGDYVSQAQPSQSSGAWLSASPMNVARKGHTATLLRDGRVLVAGGEDAGFQTLKSAEIYDPATGQWSPTGNLNEARSGNSAVLLMNGKVLLIGKQSAEIFDPSTGQWTPTVDMAIKGSPGNYQGASVTVLADGRVLVAGGSAGILSIAQPRAELFDPASGTWKATSSMNNARYNHSATLLSGGKVLVAGGSARSGELLTTTELYDPATGNWSFMNNLNLQRTNHRAALLSSGKILVFGGAVTEEIYDPATNNWRFADRLLIQAHIGFVAVTLPDGNILVIGGGTNRVERYAPNAGRWSFITDLSIPRQNHTATVLTDGRVLVTGGGSNSEAFRSVEIFDPSQSNASGFWQSKEIFGIGAAITGHTATRLANDRVLITGGERQQVAITDSLIFSGLSDEQTNGALNFARRNHTATLLPDGQVLAVGGEQASNNTLLSCELFDPATRGWRVAASLTTPRRLHTATLLTSGKAMIAGGANENTDLDSVELYDSTVGRWSSSGALNMARRGHSATLLADGRVLVAGGTRNGVPLDSAELYDPNTGTWSLTGSLKTARHPHTATLLASGKVLVIGGFTNDGPANAEIYDPSTGQWSDATQLKQPRQNHTAALLADGRVLVAGGFTSLDGRTTSAEIFDSADNGGAGGWQTTDSLDVPQAGHTATVLTDGKVMIYAGSAGPPVVEMFDPTLTTTPLPPRITPVSAGSYLGESFAPESIIAIFGERFTTGITVASSTPLPLTLGGVSVLLRDRLGLTRSAPLFFVSPNQVNCQIPPQTLSGLLTITLTTSTGIAITEWVLVTAVAPSIFTLDASGKGLPSAVVLRVKAGGAQVYEPIAQFDQMQNRFVAAPIDLSNPNEQVFLILYGTGLRFRSSLSATMASVGGTPAEVLYAGLQGEFVGLDQVNLRLPRSLAGRGEVEVLVTADGVTTNAVRVSIK